LVIVVDSISFQLPNAQLPISVGEGLREQAVEELVLGEGLAARRVCAVREGVLDQVVVEVVE